MEWLGGGAGEKQKNKSTSFSRLSHLPAYGCVQLPNLGKTKLKRNRNPKCLVKFDCQINHIFFILLKQSLELLCTVHFLSSSFLESASQL